MLNVEVYAQLFLLLLLRQRPAAEAEAALRARCGVDDRAHALDAVGLGGAGASGEQTVETDADDAGSA